MSAENRKGLAKIRIENLLQVFAKVKGLRTYFACAFGNEHVSQCVASKKPSSRLYKSNGLADRSGSRTCTQETRHCPYR